MTTNFTQGWLTLSEVAKFLRVSPTTVRRLITTGRLRANNTSCATRPLWRIHEQWIESGLQDIRQKTLIQAISDSIAGEQLGKANRIIQDNAPLLVGHVDALRAKAAAKGRELEARSRADSEMRFVGAFANDPLKGIAEISTPEAVEKLFNSDTPMSIMNSNAITVDDALSNVSRVISAGGAGKDKKPKEGIADNLKRNPIGGAE